MIGNMLGAGVSPQTFTEEKKREILEFAEKLLSGKHVTVEISVGTIDSEAGQFEIRLPTLERTLTIKGWLKEDTWKG